MEIRNNRSDSYFFSLDPKNSDDMEMLSRLRAQVSAMNKSNKGKPGYVMQRVIVRGREPMVKQEVSNFWTRQTRIAGYDFGGNIVGGLKNATRFDVYILDRR